MKKRHLLVFQLEIEGRKRREIAAITGISEHTLNIYMAKNGKWRPEFEAWEKEMIKDIERDARIRIQKRLVEALTVQETLLTMVRTHPAEAGRAARDFLDRAGLIAPKSKPIVYEDKAERMMKTLERIKAGRERANSTSEQFA